MAKKSTGKKPKSINLIPKGSLDKHYNKKGKWRTDKDNVDGYDDIGDYAAEHPEYVFQSSKHTKEQINPKTGEPYKYTNKYVAVHDKKFGKDLGASFYTHMGHGGGVVRIGERKLK